MRRHTRVAVAATVASLLLLGGLAACSGDSGGDATPSPTASTDAAAAAEPTEADIAALEAVTVAGDAGAEPALTFEMPFTVTAPVARVTAEGTGDDLVDGQSLTMNYIAVSGVDGAKQTSTYGATADHITLGDDTYIAALNEVLAGQKVGVRFLLALPAPAAAAGATADPATGSTLMALEIAAAKTIPSRAEGEAVTPTTAGLPAVTLADDGTPSIEVVAGDAPTTLAVQPLIKGTGPAVTSGQSITVQYTGWLWDGTEFDSSWGKTPITTAIGTGAVIPGWDQGLVGQTVGSQVLLVIPPDLGYGAEAKDPIPANSTLVFVVDILDAS